MDRKSARSRSRQSTRASNSPTPLRLTAKRTSAIAFAVAAALAGSHAYAQQAPGAFGSMVAMQNGMVQLPNGSMSKWTGANRPVIGTGADGRPLMTIEQTEQRALLDWERFELQANEVLEFQQQRADWIAVNRVHSDSASRIDGEIRATGRVFILNDNGVLMGADAKVNTRQLVTGKGIEDVIVDGATTTIVQGKEVAQLNWHGDFQQQAGEALRFQQQRQGIAQKDWVVLNRFIGPNVTHLNGEIKADGHVYLVSPSGLSVGGKIEAQQVMVSSLNITDAQLERGLMENVGPGNARRQPTLSNLWRPEGEYTDYSWIPEDAPLPQDLNDPRRFNVTIEQTGSIKAGTHGKVMVFGPNVTNRGTLHVQDEGQVLMAAGENIWLTRYDAGNGRVSPLIQAYTGPYSQLSMRHVDIFYRLWNYRIREEDLEMLRGITGRDLAANVGQNITSLYGQTEFANLVSAFAIGKQSERIRQLGFNVRNEGEILAERGGRVDFTGFNLAQMGIVTATSTALFRGGVQFQAYMYDWDQPGDGYPGPVLNQNGHVVFGRNSLTQILPDLDSIDALPLTQANQSVGTLKVNARTLLMEQDSLILMPSGNMQVLLEVSHGLDNNRGPSGNTDNEDGSRFLMERGATIDLSGWDKSVLPMSFHQVSGRLFAAQLRDSPLQRDGSLYRREISVDRRHGTNIADWSSFDNLNQGTLAQFLIDGGKFSIDVGDDFIMKQGSLIDVSGGKITYESGYVYTTLLRRLDGTVIDIREADPDELYMGLANEWVKYDTKWQRQASYYIPLMSSMQGRYETSYEHGGKGGNIDILAPDSLLQGTVMGGVTAGRYQRANLPAAGSFTLNDAGQSETEYASNRVLITNREWLLPESFGLEDDLSEVYDDLFGEEYDREAGLFTDERRNDNATLLAADFFNRSSMGEFVVRQMGDSPPREGADPDVTPVSVVVESGVQLNLANGASFELSADRNIDFLGGIRTEGGDVTFRGAGVRFASDTRIDTRGSWYSDYEYLDYVPVVGLPRIHGGDVSITATNSWTQPLEGVSLIMPNGMQIDTTGGAWVQRDGRLVGGKGGSIRIDAASLLVDDELDLSAKMLAYGLGGNGGYNLAFGGSIYIGDNAPPPAPEEPNDPTAPIDPIDPTDPDAPTPSDPADVVKRVMHILPSFFSNSGFSSINLRAAGGDLTIAEGTQIAATSAQLQLNPGVRDGMPSVWFAPSGTDIYDVATPGYLSPELRPGALRDGMDVSFNASSFTVYDQTFGGKLVMGAGSQITTEVGGSLALAGVSNDIHGTLIAPSGNISLNAGGATEVGKLTIHDTARVLASGTALVLDRSLAGDGRLLLDGEVLDGGKIVLDADTIRVEAGASFDVSGTSAVFDVAKQPGPGSVARVPTTIASDGGEITISGRSLDIDGGVYRGFAGGAGARGGSFGVTMSADYGLLRDTTAEQVYGMFSWLFDPMAPMLFDVDGNPVTSFFGTDLSRVDWMSGFGMELEFAPGFSIADEAALVAMLKNYDLGVFGPAPVLMIGDSLPPPTTGSDTPPQFDSGLRTLIELMAGYEFPVRGTVPMAQAGGRLSTGTITNGGFSSLNLTGVPGLMFVGNATLDGRKADGSFLFDQINLAATRIVGADGAQVRIGADVVNLGAAEPGTLDDGLFEAGLAMAGVNRDSPTAVLTVQAGKLLQIESAHFDGFADSRLFSHGDIRLTTPALNGVPAPGGIYSPGKLTFKADQLYATTGRTFDIVSDDTIEFLAQDAGTPINGSPFEAGATLNITAPRIVQGGTIRSPLGVINLTSVADGSEGADTITLLPGSLTSVSGVGNVIPYGVTANGDTWLNPLGATSTEEMIKLPEKAVKLTGDVIDMQQGAVLDVSGGGDLFAWEFTPGVGGSTDWLTGYRNEDYDWVNDASGVFAVIPDFAADIAPVGLGNEAQLGNMRIGERIYLSGGSGLPAGHYTLLPARYALLPGAFRVTLNHHRGGDYQDMQPGTPRVLTDGSSIQSGYRYLPGATPGEALYSEQRSQGYLVMPGSTLRTRSEYVESHASTFFLSEAFLKKALRTNRPVGDVPRTPLDGGSVVLEAGSELQLNATLLSAAAKGGRGGFADIKAERIAVVGANTDRSLYEDDYLILDSDRLNAFGAESLLLGGVRRQGDVNLEVEVAAKEVVVDNAGSVLQGPELLFVAGGSITLEEGSDVRTSGQISGSSGDLRMLPYYERTIDDLGTPYTWDDVLLHETIDKGTVLRLSSSEQVNILRDIASIDRMSALLADPAALDAINTRRVAMGFDPIESGGSLLIKDGANLSSTRSLALDATIDTRIETGAAIAAKQVSASSSRISIGEVPAGTSGLVFSGGSLGALAAAEDLLLRSYSSVDFHGSATLRATNSLQFDSRHFRGVNTNGGTITLAADELTLTNTLGGTATSSMGNGTLRLEARNVHFAGDDKWIDGVSTVDAVASERVIGHDDGTLFVPGDLRISTASLTAESGARLFLDATGAVTINQNGNAADLEDFDTLGATLSVVGSTLTSNGRIDLTSGIVSLRARDGDVNLSSGSLIDVTGDVSQIFDVRTGVSAGTVNLIADRANVVMASDATIDVSGTPAGGDGGALNVSAGLGRADLAGRIRGDAQAGYRSGSFSLLTQELADFAGFNSLLDGGGFRQARHFEVNQGDVVIDSTVRVQDFALVANDGSINVTGSIETLGSSGGRIQLSAAESVTLSSGSRLLANAKAADGAGGTVFLETVGRNGGVVDVGAGSLIDVTGTGEGGRTVRLRGPQIGNDIAIAAIQGTITGARSVLAEGFRAYEGISTIDQGVIDTVSNDATLFMANAAAIAARLGGQGVTVVPGIELRSDSDMELTTDWDLHTLRFGDAAGVLTLRAGGDILINANLSDGFDGSATTAALINGDSWTLNLTAGANTEGPNSLAVLPEGLLEEGKGSLIVGGTPDTIEYYKTSDGSRHRLYLKDADGNFIRTPDANPYLGFQELAQDVNGNYLDPVTGEIIGMDPVTGDYVDTARYGRRALPTIYSDNGGYRPPNQFGNVENFDALQYGQSRGVQWDNSTGYLVRTGTAAINIATGRDLLLKYRPSVIYTAGESSADVAGFHKPTRIPLLAWDDLWAPFNGYYPENGGDINIRAQGDVIGSGSNQLPSAWLWRYGSVNGTGAFRRAEEMRLGDHSLDLGREYDQTTWFVRFDRYQAGIGALGGGNVDIDAGGDVSNVTVNIPNTGRVTGNTLPDEPMTLHTTGGGDLRVRAGGNIETGVFYVADGIGELTAGGAFTSGRQVSTWRQAGRDAFAIHDYDLYTMLLTSSGSFRLQSGGDLNIDAVMDPLHLPQSMNNIVGSGGTYGPDNTLHYVGDSRTGYGMGFPSYSVDSSVSLFSAGGDVVVWNNAENISAMQWAGDFMNPQHVYTRGGNTSPAHSFWPATLSAVAAAGDIDVRGGMYLLPSPTGNLDLIAKGGVHFGETTRPDDPEAFYTRSARNYYAQFNLIYMSQAYPELLPDALHFGFLLPSVLTKAGLSESGRLELPFSLEHLPVLHANDPRPVRIYAAEGDIVTTGPMTFPKQTWLQAGRHIYFPELTVQHNNPNDMTLVRAGEGMYFGNNSYLNISGPGRLEIETGRDFWIPSNAFGITTNRITLAEGVWKPEENAADIAISTGFNQTPDYQAFEDLYLNPELASEMAEYLLKDAGDGRELPMYLFDRLYARADQGTGSEFVTPELAMGFVNYVRSLQGLDPLLVKADQTAYLPQAWDYWLSLPATQQTAYDGFMPRVSKAEAEARGLKPEFYLPEAREGLVNYVRRLQGLEPLGTQQEQLAYLDEAWSYWNTLSSDYKTPLYRNAFFLELRTTGREATDPKSDRENTTFRGYDAIATLFPGAQRPDAEALQDGESRWAGDFETFASRVISYGGGKVDMVIPGGQMMLAHVTASAGQTGQPTGPGSDGNAERAGVITKDGGEINIFAHDSVTLNESRIMTAKGGNIMTWSSYGDIAAGKGAKTSISPPFFAYKLNSWWNVLREPGGLPTGAGIATLASQPGTPVADVDLVAPNGIVDAGDAGIRVSGNFNVFALQILGTDNIDVQGVSTGLPVPPAAPPTSLNVDDAASKSQRVTGALQESLKEVQENAAIKAPSIIEVKVLGYGEECAEDRKDCAPDTESPSNRN